ncbi:MULTISPECIES: alpha/beta hydrolase [Alphaproteobacteria]|uniref:Dienelactone hydrolase domain-containing protein n=2 Tax=Alphaproteobacteria TaxID=28211 RepID=A0A512HGT8_9HYPH|nr:hypothetical protein RNA01_16060 [Ciceribacter naphthalenivorans]GLR20705.1 hypothetical protein GCM10007920_04890 [Ciceribacter naphthalenivorans]GLT03561.1 hypothetical protein GCM10007926_04890 [Sphingomonas psychrolutea]
MEREHPVGGRVHFFSKGPQGKLIDAEILARCDELHVRLVKQLPARRQVVLMGYSSGATMAAALAFRHPQVARAAMLLRPQPPFSQTVARDLSGLPVLIIAGSEDPRRTPEDAPRLASQFTAVGAAVEFHLLRTGHGWEQSGLDRTITKDWLGRSISQPEL